MAQLHRMQSEHGEWQRRNFPDQIPQQAFMGMVEELGEMSHAMLKHQQGIREINDENVMDLIIDAHCDLIIFSLGLANGLGYDLESELGRVWDKVKNRDWILDPTRGGQP